MAGEEQRIRPAREEAEGRIALIVITVHAFEIKHAGVELQRLGSSSCSERTG